MKHKKKVPTRVKKQTISRRERQRQESIDMKQKFIQQVQNAQNKGHSIESVLVLQEVDKAQINNKLSQPAAIDVKELLH